MDTTAIEILANGYPRTVAAGDNGSLKQTFIHSFDEMMLYFESNRQERNLYMNIARFRQDMRPITGDFAFDFDSPMKESAFSDDVNDREKIKRMREDEDLAEMILGSVWDDTQKLVSHCYENNIPVITVFSGLGVHCHLLYQEQVNPTEKKTTTCYHLVDELDLSTHDRQIIPDTKRILRVPNSKRFDNGVDCGVYCIPMTELEVLNNSLHDMLERCKAPKTITYNDEYKSENRPEMREYDVDVDVETANNVSLEERDIEGEVPEDVEYIVREFIPMPCVRERFLRSNPDHKIRFSGVAFLYQVGFQPEEVMNIIRDIGWIDYDEATTRKQCQSIWNNRYSEMSCSALWKHGLCVYGPESDDFSDDPSDCETYKYKSGEAIYGN